MVKESTREESSSIIFEDRKVVIDNSEFPEPDITLGADFRALSDASGGGTNTGVKAMLTGKMERGRSFFSLLKLQKILSTEY